MHPDHQQPAELPAEHTPEHHQPHHVSGHDRPHVYHHTEQHTTRHSRRHSVVHHASKSIVFATLIVGWAFLLSLMVVGIIWVVFVQLGIDPGKTEVTKAQSAQIAFWATVWTMIALFFLHKSFRNRRRIFARYSRRVLLIALPVALVIGVATTASLSIAAYIEPTSTETCHIQDTLNTALASTISVNTDSGRGSGFFVDGNGLIVTSYHIVKGAKTIYTWKDSDIKVPLQIVRTSPEYDLALLQYPEPAPAHLPFAGIDEEHPAEEVYAIGYPGNAFSEGYATVTNGIVSRKVIPSRSHNLPDDIQLLQTDAAINPGNSGGPIINKCGAVGVAEAISTSDTSFGGLPREEGIGYAVSSETVKRVLELP